MKIAHVFHNYHPLKGGLEKVIQKIAEIQAQNGHRVTVITSNVNLDKAIPKIEFINGVKVERLNSLKLFHNHLTFPLENPSDKDFDVIHAHNQNSIFTLRIAKELKQQGAKIAFHFMAVDSLSDHPSPSVRLFGPIYSRRNVCRAIKIADLKLVKSWRDQEILIENYNQPSHYVPDGLSDYYFSKYESDPKEFREQFGVDQEKLFLYIGRLHRMKGPQLIVEALKYLDNPKVGLLFVGPDDGFKDKLINQARDLGVLNRVHLLGYLDEKTKINAIDSSEALIIPSVSDYVETFSLVMSEAWARCTPVIASEIGELPYRIRKNKAGILFEPSNPKSLASAMKRILNKNYERVIRENEIRKNIMSWKQVVEKLDKLYRNVLSRKE